MTNVWWTCKTCWNESYDSVTAFHHTQDTGHEGHTLATTGVGPGPGSTPEGRAAALAHCKALIADARRRHQETRGAVGHAHRRQDHTSEETKP